MIAQQLLARGIHDPRVLAVMLELPREAFIPPERRGLAYIDAPVGLSCGQTISQPFIVAHMLELLALKPDDRVLEVGTGTGYQAALLAGLVREVVTLERLEPLASQARANLAALGIATCEVRVGDGTLGAPDRAPFDAIIVAAGGPRVPSALVEQLAPGGRMVAPIGSRTQQELVRVTRSPDGRTVRTEALGGVMFVPLVGADAWSEGD